MKEHLVAVCGITVRGETGREFSWDQVGTILLNSSSALAVPSVVKSL